jgi:hypothetical protein
MSNECLELKTIKYKSMLLSGNSEGPVETVENLSNLDQFLAGEKKNSSNEVWAKLDKTTKLLYLTGSILDFLDSHLGTG